WTLDLSSLDIATTTEAKLNIKEVSGATGLNERIGCIAADDQGAIEAATTLTMTSTLTTNTTNRSASTTYSYDIYGSINEVIRRSGWDGQNVTILMYEQDDPTTSSGFYSTDAVSSHPTFSLTYKPSAYPLMISVEPYRKYNEIECVLKITGRWLI
ncbi:MAG: hypothetical protein GY849_17930, partial [Deltaproteobacteria bacterium]|nr:hypothetical protein [Deltaproteobacteria bacterium]